MIMINNSVLKRTLRKTENFVRTDLRYILRGGSFLFFAQVVGSITALLLAVGYAHYLPKEVYGTYKYILSILGTLSLFSLAGMDTAVQRGVAQGKDAIFWKTFCFLIKYCGLSGLILGRIAFSSVPFSLAYSRFNDAVI